MHACAIDRCSCLFTWPFGLCTSYSKIDGFSSHETTKLTVVFGTNKCFGNAWACVTHIHTWPFRTMDWILRWRRAQGSLRKGETFGNKCDTIKGNESHVGNIQFWFFNIDHLIHLKCYILIQRSSQSNIWLQRYEQFCKVQKQCKT